MSLGEPGNSTASGSHASVEPVLTWVTASPWPLNNCALPAIEVKGASLKSAIIATSLELPHMLSDVAGNFI